MITDRPGMGTGMGSTGLGNGATGVSTSTTGSSSSGGMNDVKDQAREKIGQLGQMAREKATDAANYVRERGFTGLRTDIVDATTRNPLGAVAVSLGIGYVLGRLMTRR